MKTFEQLVYSCLNDGVINPSDHVDLESIMNLLKPMCVLEYWNDFLILKPDESYVSSVYSFIDNDCNIPITISLSSISIICP